MDRIVNIQSLTIHVYPTIHVKNTIHVYPTIHVKDECTKKESNHPFISSVSRARMQQTHGLGSIPLRGIIFEATDIGACVKVDILRRYTEDTVSIQEHEKR
jgi:hypothetical protein